MSNGLLMKTGIAMTAILTGGYIAVRNGSDRRCSYPDAVANFDVDRYYGRWYEIVRDSTIQYETGDCVTADYSAQTDGNVGVKNTQYFFDTETLDGVEGHAVPIEGYLGALAVKFAWI